MGFSKNCNNGNPTHSQTAHANTERLSSSTQRRLHLLSVRTKQVSEETVDYGPTHENLNIYSRSSRYCSPKVHEYCIFGHGSMINKSDEYHYTEKANSSKKKSRLKHVCQVFRNVLFVLLISEKLLKKCF